MRKRHFPLVLVTILAVGLGAGGVTGLILAAIGLFAAYVLSLRIHPRMRHWRCKGTGESRGAIFTWTHRKCRGCQGGRIVRRGAAIWGPEHVRHEHARGKAARASAKSSGSWR